MARARAKGKAIGQAWYCDGDLRETIQTFCTKHGFSLVDYALSANAKSAGKPKRSQKRP